MKKDYETRAVAGAAQPELALPDGVTVAMGDLAEKLREGLLALAVGTGLQVMEALMEEDVTALCGPKGRRDLARAAVRHGSEAGSVTLGGRRVPVRRPRVRIADGAAEVAVPSYELFSSTELLGRMAMEKMLAQAVHPPLPPRLSNPSATPSRGRRRRRRSRRCPGARQRHRDGAGRADGRRPWRGPGRADGDGVRFAEHTCIVALCVTK